jgi:hypothetical protein
MRKGKLKGFGENKRQREAGRGEITLMVRNRQK